MDKFHYLVLKSLLVIVELLLRRESSEAEILTKQLRDELRLAQESGFDYYREDR